MTNDRGLDGPSTEITDIAAGPQGAERLTVSTAGDVTTDTNDLRAA